MVFPYASHRSDSCIDMKVLELGNDDVVYNFFKKGRKERKKEGRKGKEERKESKREVGRMI